MATYTVALDQVQGNVMPGFRKDCQDFLFLRLPPETFALTPDRTRARAWLQALRPSIATAREVASFNALYVSLKRRIEGAGGQGSAEQFLRSTWVNVAFTYRGHAALYDGALGTDAEQCPAFRAGMFNRNDDTRDYLEELGACTVRDSVRGDLDGFGATPAAERAQVAHVLVIIGADSETELDVELRTQLELATSHGLSLVERFRGTSLGGGREHFGFKDGISQPDPVDLLSPQGWVTSEQVAAPGEFVRGAAPEPDNADVREVLPWEMNGSYLVFRRLDQDVQRFRDEAVAQAAALNAGTAPGMTPALFEAKCVGRWPDGTPVDRPPLAPGATETTAERRTRLTVTACTYAADPDGLKIPRFAHIRKAYPRDRADAHPQHHRLIRRGIPFGPVLPSTPTGAQPTTTDERGLLFVAYMANIEQQFEFLMQNWFGSRIFASAAHRPSPGFDPIVGKFQYQHASPRDVRHVTREGDTLRYQQLSIRRFITLKGGGYFFSPSIAHLATLAGA